MKQKIKDQIIAYVHSTLDMVEGDREKVWSAAIELSNTTQSIDEFKAGLTKEISEELEPLIEFVKNPDKHLKLAEADLGEARKFILGTIAVHANSLKEAPSKELPDKNVKEIAAQQKEKIQGQIDAAEGKNSNNVDHASEFELQQDRDRFFNTLEGRQYLQQRAIVNYVPRSFDPDRSYLIHSILANYTTQSLFNQVGVALPLAQQSLHVIASFQANFSNVSSFVSNYNLEIVFASVGDVLGVSHSYIYVAYNAWQALQITSNLFESLLQRQLPAPEEQRVEEIADEAEAQPHSFYESVTNIARSASTQAYRLWESTVGVSVTNNISSMWSRARQQVTSALAQHQAQNTTPAPENRGRVQHV